MKPKQLIKNPTVGIQSEILKLEEKVSNYSISKKPSQVKIG